MPYKLFISHTNSHITLGRPVIRRAVEEYCMNTSQTGYRRSRIIRLYSINSANERECSIGYSVTSIEIKLVGSSNRGLKSTLSCLHDLIPNTGYFHFSHTKCQRHRRAMLKTSLLCFFVFVFIFATNDPGCHSTRTAARIHAKHCSTGKGDLRR